MSVIDEEQTRYLTMTTYYAADIHGVGLKVTEI